MFIEEYLQELRQGRFAPAAFARYAARAWQRGRLDVAANPEAARSLVILGILLFWASFLGALALGISDGLRDARLVLISTGLWLIPVTGGLVLHVGMLRDRQGYRLSGVNLPTVVTTARLAAVPAMYLLLCGRHWQAAFWLFLIAMLSDVVDGWTARHLGQETPLGKVLDPITDIFFHLALFLGLWRVGLVGPWAGGLATFRYGGLLLGGIYIYLVHGPVRINSTLPGKVSGFVLAVLLGFLLLGPAYGAGPVGRVLLPLAHDAVVVLLAAGIVHGAFMGWHNLRHASAESRGVITDVRFGDRG